MAKSLGADHIYKVHILINNEGRLQVAKSLGASVVDPDPHGSGTLAWIRIRIQVNMKEQISKNVISLCSLRAKKVLRIS